MISDDARFFADKVVEYIKKDFVRLHLSGNLVNTISVSTFDNKLVINIPAATYDMYKYLKEKVIVYNNWGSYASQLDTEGSYIFSKHIGNHIRYIDWSLSCAMMDLENKAKANNKKVRVDLQ